MHESQLVTWEDFMLTGIPERHYVAALHTPTVMPQGKCEDLLNGRLKQLIPVTFTCSVQDSFPSYSSRQLLIPQFVVPSRPTLCSPFSFKAWGSMGLPPHHHKFAGSLEGKRSLLRRKGNLLRIFAGI